MKLLDWTHGSEVEGEESRRGKNVRREGGKWTECGLG
jgi:hypothetical protein